MTAEANDLALDQVVWRKDLYPRQETDPRKVDQYAEDLTVLPPIEVNQHNELIDGWHRWTAHRKAGATTVPAVVTETRSDEHLLELAIRRNATHGLQLSAEDKRSMGRRIYNATPEREREGKKTELASILSVSERTVRDWLSRIDKDAKEDRDQRIFEAWLACRTQQEIAEFESISQGEVSKSIPNGDFAEWNISAARRATAEHATDFEPPLYNVWKQQEKTPGGKHFGNSEVRWVDNLLYLYTQPFDVVVDPFAGSGSTADVCRKRLRRYWVSDRKPAVGREEIVREHDVTEGLPRLPWKDVALVYLDPPYWKQAEGQYSDDPTDLGNMELEEFTAALSKLIREFAAKMRSGSHVALIIQPTQWKAPGREFTDHVADMLRAVKEPVATRISVPYESQQYNAQQVEWAKANRQILVLTREIVVWRVS